MTARPPALWKWRCWTGSGSDACAAPNGSTTIRIISDGYPALELDTAALEPDPAEVGTSAALVRGVCRAVTDRGYAVGGFDACITSQVPGGSGLSSSAAYEVLVGVIVNHLFCNDELSPVELAQIGQYAENTFFGKPSGLMDQMASSLGGVVHIDFADPANPLVEPIAFDMAASGHVLCIVDSGADHADLTSEYAAITDEMRAEYQRLGLPAGPFQSVAFFAPTRKGSDTPMPDTGSRQEGVQPYVWTVREFCRERLLRFVFVDGEDARAQIHLVISRAEQALERAARDGDQSDASVVVDGTPVASFSDLVDLLDSTALDNMMGGAPVAGGTLGDWDNTFALVLGNEPSGDRQWRGVLRLAAIHNRALTATQVQENFDAGVGERFYLLFNVSAQVGAPDSYIMFEVSQFDSYSYLFYRPTFINLNADWQPSGSIPVRGLLIGANGTEVPVSQAWGNLNEVISTDKGYSPQTGQVLSSLGTVVPLEKGPDADEFFLSFAVLGGSTNVRV